MGVKIKRKRKGNFIRRIKKQARNFEPRVKIGIFDEGVLKYAAAHEFGTRIKVTEKMRRFFQYMHSQHPDVWFPLKASTKFIVIPRRSYLSAFISNKNTIRPYAIDIVNKAVLKGKKPNLDSYANNIVKENKKFYKTISFPPKTKLAKFQSGTDKLLRGHRDGLFNSLEGRVEK